MRSFEPTRTPAPEIIAGYDGYLAKFMGDGLLAYFGFPRAHEDDAERAVRAGLGLADAVERPLRARIGVATGSSSSATSSAKGRRRSRPWLATRPIWPRLQDHATVGSVLIADSTRLLLGDAFGLESPVLFDLKGLDAPVRAWAVLREAENVSRFEASRSRRMTPFVGREPEVATFQTIGTVAIEATSAVRRFSPVRRALCERPVFAHCFPCWDLTGMPASGRFEPFAAPSGNDRYSRTPDGPARCIADATDRNLGRPRLGKAVAHRSARKARSPRSAEDPLSYPPHKGRGDAADGSVRRFEPRRL